MKSHPIHRLRGAAMVCVVATASIWASAAPVDAGSGARTAIETTASTREPAQRLNLLSAPRPGKPAATKRSIGNGSWICSAAGFGQRSRCHRG